MNNNNKKLPSKIIEKIFDKIFKENAEKNGFSDSLDLLNSIRYIAILRFLDNQYEKKQSIKLKKHDQIL